jgi:hypothetical protein
MIFWNVLAAHGSYVPATKSQNIKGVLRKRKK